MVGAFAPRRAGEPARSGLLPAVREALLRTRL